jgi:WD40 repeat protein
MAFSPDGKTILTGSHDKTACLWDTATCQLLGPPLRHAAEIDAVAFSPDGRLVATGSRDNKVRLWAVAPPVEGDPDRIILWAEVLTGMELDKHGVVSVLDGPAWHARKQKMHALGDFSITRSPLTAR